MKFTFTVTAKKLLLCLLIASALAALGASTDKTAPAAQDKKRVGRWLPGTLEIHHLYMGQGDSTLIISPSGKTMLYDLGERDWPLHENAEYVAEYIEQVTGKTEIDYLVISHYHQDHTGNSKLTESKNQYDGGIFWLLKSKRIKVGKVIDRGFSPLLPRTPIAQKYKEFAESPEGKKLFNRETVILGTGQINLGSEVMVTAVAANGKVLKEGRETTVLPDSEVKADPPPSENDLSLCLLLRWKEFEYFIGGDLSGQDIVSPFGYKYHDIETGVAGAVGNVEVYRVNHHGSDHSSNKRFIDVLDPEVSIDSSGTANRFGHPRQEVIDELLATGDLFITSREGGSASSQYKRAVEGGNVIVRVYDGYNYDVSVVRTYRSYTDEEESRHIDQLLDYDQIQVQYEETGGVRKIEDDDDGTKSGDVKADKFIPAQGAAAAADDANEPKEKNGVPRIRARDRVRLKQYIDKKVYVWGKVTSTFTPASNKVKFLNIDTQDLKESFTVVVFSKDWPNFFDAPGIGDPCKYYQNKWVEVSGTITSYKAPPPQAKAAGNSAGNSEKGTVDDKAGKAEAGKAEDNKLEVVISHPRQIEILPYREDGKK